MLFRVIFFTILVFNYCWAQTPIQDSSLKKAELVEIIKLDTSLHLDIKYATINNFSKKIVYKQAKAFLQKPAAEALVRANAKLKLYGYGIIVFDGYRPWDVTNFFWQTATKEQQEIGFVADPKTGSKHNRGCAIDVSLYDLKTGKEIEMPSEYDEFSERAFINYTGGSQEAKEQRDLLAKIMASEDFKVIDEEWWHFDYKDWKLYPILNLSFDELLD